MFQTTVIFCGIMASAFVAEAVVGDMLMENETAGDNQEKTFSLNFLVQTGTIVSSRGWGTLM